jgi:hypothetical protein
VTASLLNNLLSMLMFRSLQRTPYGRSFKTAMDRIPGDSPESSDGGLVQAWDAETCHLIREKS